VGSSPELNYASGGYTMSMTYDSGKQGNAVASIRGVFSFFKRYSCALQERRERRKLQTTLDALSDRELRDIGITRGEIDHVAFNRYIDPRGILSTDWVRYLPTVDGYLPGRE
jgi:uncharacterized protein YjiS (DUF1127 family)